MTFQLVVPTYAPRSTDLPHAAARSRIASLVSVLALLVAVPACAEAVPVSPEDVLVISQGQAQMQAEQSTDAVQEREQVLVAQDGATLQDEEVDEAALDPEALDPEAELPLAAEADSDSSVSQPEQPGEQSPPAAAAPRTTAATPRPTMHTSGRFLLDSCGEVFVTRGVEQIFGNQLPEGNDWSGLLEQIAASGVNAVRILAGTNTLGVEDVDTLLNAVARHQMVAYVTPYGSEAGNWLSRPEVRTMLAKHERYILIDAFGEPTFDDRERFVAEATDSLRRVRSWGYRVPLTVTANQFGRDLPSILELGEQIIAADPLNNTVMGWQAYWGNTGYYQQTYGMSLTEGVAAAARAPFPVQLGLDRITDFPSDVTADFESLMTATEANDIGWLWWDWYNPYGNENSLTHDGSAENLTETGHTVVTGHPASVANTARRACSGS
jgi:hypothetical protein